MRMRACDAIALPATLVGASAMSRHLPVANGRKQGARQRSAGAVPRHDTRSLPESCAHMPKTTDFLFHPESAYRFVRQDTGDFICSVRDAAWQYDSRHGFYRLIEDAEGRKATQSMYEEINGVLYPVDERTLEKTDSSRDFWPTDETARQEYQGIAKYAPLDINEGDRWHYISDGRWTWRRMQAGLNPVEGAGTWHYDVTGFLLLGRLTIFEVWTETVDGSSEQHLFNRTEVFDRDGFLGFDDEYATGWNGMIVKE